MTCRQVVRAVVAAAVLSVVCVGMGWAQDPPVQAERVYRVGRGVTAPKPLKTLGPEFSKEAQRDKVDGTIALSFIVGVDGHTRDIKLKNSIGHGLDEEAIRAVQKWTFVPGMKDGQPVAVEVNAEVNFRLYGHL
jgi:protein TonB